MTTITTDPEEESGLNGPLDLIEHLISENEWPCERTGEDELTATVKGSWCDYHLRFIWRDDFRTLQIASLFDLKVAEHKRQAIYETLAIINERMWLGHFDVWAEQGLLMYRYALVLPEDGGLTLDQYEDLMHNAVEECERFFPVFQFVLEGDKSPAEAVEAAMLEPMGEA